MDTLRTCPASPRSARAGSARLAARPSPLLVWLPPLALLLSTAAALAAVPEALVLTSDFTTGKLSVLLSGPEWTVVPDVAPVCADAAGRVAQGLVYVINRGACNDVEAIDPAGGWTVRGEFSVGSGSNPQDIAFVSADRAYVSRYATNWLLEVDPATGTILDSLSLAPFADGDGLCEMHRLCLAAGRLFVEVQRLDEDHGWVPVPPSYLAVVDPVADRLVDIDPDLPGVQGIPLAGLNPAAPIAIDPGTGDLLVPEAGAFGVLDQGGLERVDPVACVSRGFVITEEELGGDLSSFAWWSDSLAYAVVADPTGNTALVSFNPSTGRRTGVLYQPGGYVLADCLISSRGDLLLADQGYTDPGIRVFDAATGSFLAGPLSTGLPPLVLLSAEGLQPPPTSPALTWMPVPNPAAGAVEVRYREGGPAAAGAEVFDLSGRRIRRLLPAPPGSGPGPGSLTWDLRDGMGHRVGSGVYRIRAAMSDGRVETHPVTVLR
jgi:hypothetical protein